MSEPGTVVLTGVSSGIGRATLQKLLIAGHTVFGSVRKQTDADKIMSEDGHLQGKFVPLVFDVTDQAAIQAAVSLISEQLGGRKLAALINNAGMNVGPDPAELIPLEKFRRQLEVNLVGPLAVAQAFLPLLGTDRSRTGNPGRLIFIGSIYGSYGLPWQAAYCATKFGLEALSESLRVELRLFGIQVVIVRPGPASSEIWEKSMRSEAALEHGVGDWGRYADSQYSDAMQSTRKFVVSEMDSSDFYLPCSAIANTIHKAVTAKSAKPRMLKTSRYMEAWFLPRWVPLWIRDSIVAMKLGIKPLNDTAYAAKDKCT